MSHSSPKNNPLFPGDLEPYIPYESQIDDTFVDETQCFPVMESQMIVSQAEIVRGTSSSTRRPQFHHRNTKFLTPRWVRTGSRNFVDAEGSPGITDMYESDDEDVYNLLEDDATFSTPRPNREIQPKKSSSELFVYELNGVPIDLLEVHPSVHKLLLSQYQSYEYGKLPPKALTEMWKVGHAAYGANQCVLSLGCLLAAMVGNLSFTQMSEDELSYLSPLRIIQSFPFWHSFVAAKNQ